MPTLTPLNINPDLYARNQQLQLSLDLVSLICSGVGSLPKLTDTLSRVQGDQP